MTFYIVYDILIKSDNESYYHKAIIEDNIFINLEGQIVDNINDTYDRDRTSIPGFEIPIVVAVSLGTIVPLMVYIKKRKNKS